MMGIRAEHGVQCCVFFVCVFLAIRDNSFSCQISCLL